MKEKCKEKISMLITRLNDFEERRWKIMFDSCVNNESRAEKMDHTGLKWITKSVGQSQEPTVNDSFEIKQLLTQCKHLCVELGLDSQIVRILSK